jgi:hypothetical protein
MPEQLEPWLLPRPRPWRDKTGRHLDTTDCLNTPGGEARLLTGVWLLAYAGRIPGVRVDFEDTRPKCAYPQDQVEFMRKPTPPASPA